MKLLKFLATLFFILLIGGFLFFGFMDIPIQQTAVSKDIPHEELFDR